MSIFIREIVVRSKSLVINTDSIHCTVFTVIIGELWCAVAKAPEHHRADIGTVLKRVVEKLLGVDDTEGGVEEE